MRENERIARELAQRLAPVCAGCGCAHPGYTQLARDEHEYVSALHAELCNACWNEQHSLLYRALVQSNPTAPPHP